MKLPSDFPIQIPERLYSLYSRKEVDNILKGFKSPRKTTLRINTLKISIVDFLKKAEEESVVLESVPWSPYSFVLASPTLREFSTNPLYSEGYCYIQSLSSMIPPIVLDPKPNETILDIAAAPGSKTTQMAMMMNNTGKIVANDSSQIRLYKLAANMQMQGVTNVQIQKSVGQGIWREYPEYFDRTLVDVPCSMEGRISLDDPKSYAFWSTRKIKELAEVQRFLLKAAISATKVDGTIVYSTCTLAPEENEGVIDWILKKEPGVVEVEPIAIEHIPFSPGFSEWKEKTYNPETKKSVRLLPSEYYEGFYIAKLRKINHSSHLHVE